MDHFLARAARNIMGQSQRRAEADAARKAASIAEAYAKRRRYFFIHQPASNVTSVPWRDSWAASAAVAAQQPKQHHETRTRNVAETPCCCTLSAMPT